MRRGMQRLRIRVRHVVELAVDVADLVHELFGLRLAGLDHERFVNDEREVHCGRMEIEVQHSLGHIECGNAGFFIALE